MSSNSNNLSDFYLIIPGVEGESIDKEYPKAIQVLRWRWSEQNSGRWGFGQGGGSGKVQMGDFEFEMLTNRASPKLFLSCATGEHIPEAQLVCRKSGNGQRQFLTITFHDGLVSSYLTSGNDASPFVTNAQGGNAQGVTTANGNAGGAGNAGFDLVMPKDRITINFAEIIYEYREQRDDGSMGAVVKAGYNLKLNAAI